MRQQVASFELETTAACNLAFAGGGKGHHADMAIALALAWFASERLPENYLGQVKLKGWF